MTFLAKKNARTGGFCQSIQIDCHTCKKCKQGIAAAVLLFPVAGITTQATAFLPLPLLLVVWLLVLWKSVQTLYGIFSWESILEESFLVHKSDTWRYRGGLDTSCENSLQCAAYLYTGNACGDINVAWACAEWYAHPIVGPGGRQQWMGRVESHCDFDFPE
jgi:hypothetical protein